MTENFIKGTLKSVPEKNNNLLWVAVESEVTLSPFRAYAKIWPVSHGFVWTRISGSHDILKWSMRLLYPFPDEKDWREAYPKPRALRVTDLDSVVKPTYSAWIFKCFQAAFI